MLTQDVFPLVEEPKRDPVQSKCVLTACSFSHSGMESSPVLSYSREQPFSSIAPLRTNGGCGEAMHVFSVSMRPVRMEGIITVCLKHACSKVAKSKVKSFFFK